MGLELYLIICSIVKFKSSPNVHHQNNIIPDCQCHADICDKCSGKDFTFEVDKYDFVEDLKGQIQVNIKF